eukprot:5348895-Lingulodinium_polyedra.AAC.1
MDEAEAAFPHSAAVATQANPLTCLPDRACFCGPVAEITRGVGDVGGGGADHGAHGPVWAL